VVFDIIYLNDKSLVDCSLRQRRKALEKIITPSTGYFEILPYQTGTTEADIELKFQQVLQEA
jgi:ATP-dependent DNA ligase